MRKATPRGTMTRGNNSGPAVMLMPPDVRTTFMPNPPLQPVPPTSYRRKQKWTAVSDYLAYMETSKPPERTILPTPKTIAEERQLKKRQDHKDELRPTIETYRKVQSECGGELNGMNCYNTLFIGRLAYEVTERKLLREMETFGAVKDIQIVKKDGKSRGFAFCEYEHEEDMKRAYRAADGMRIEGRDIVVDVERGHTVPDWLPRRLGGGLGGARLGGKSMNVTRPGRYDPNRPEMMAPQGNMSHGGNIGMGRGSGVGPPQGYGGPPPQAYSRGRGHHDGPPPGGWHGGPREFERKRYRSRSPPQDRYGSRRRY